MIIQNHLYYRIQIVIDVKKKLVPTYLDRFGNDHNNQIYCSVCINFAKFKKNITLSIIRREREITPPSERFLVSSIRGSISYTIVKPLYRKNHCCNNV